MLRLLTALAAASTLGLFASGQASAAPSNDELVVAARSSGAVTMLGPLRPHLRIGSPGGFEQHASYDAAWAAFGRPGTVDRFARWGCTASWPGIGLTIGFADYGGATACRDGGWIQVARIRSQRWRTREGLRVGQSEARIRRLYPRAERHGREWWLAKSYNRIGDGGWYGTLVAVVDGGRVRRFRAAVGAAGD